MPLCLLCPTGNQPSFVHVSELTNHISEAHPNGAHNPAKPPPNRPVIPSIRCCICNKKFATLGALTTHQSAKRHYLTDSVPTPKLATSTEPARQPEAHDVPSKTVNNNTTANKSNIVGQPATVHSCSECHANFETLAQLETHRSSHKKIACSKCGYLSSSLFEWNGHFKQTHQNVQSGCSHQSELASDVIPPPCRSPSPPIIRPASSQSISSKSVTSNSHSKRLACDICKKGFKGPVGLQAHMAAKHPARTECVICHIISPSTAALEEHVDTVHSCAVCHDGILRDALALADHMFEHSHPILCKRCGTRYETEEERNLHFAAADNCHPICVACSLGFEDDDALGAHTNSACHTSPQPSLKPSPFGFSAELDVDAHASTEHHCVFQCDVCNEAYLSQTELDVHVVTVHSCPICHDGIYLDMRTLEDHLEQHRSSYVCRPCGLAYAEEDQLLEHYKTSASDVHPCCERCHLGFEDDAAYSIHADEAHPRIACDVCEGEFFDEGQLALHYASSRKHPKCEGCGIGFKDQFDYTAHGASAHPECHCYLCHWHFDTPDILQNHINHFFNHPKCQDCNVRFADADAYHHHLFAVHRPRLGDQGILDVLAIESVREGKISHGDLSSPLNALASDPVWGFEGSASFPYASYIPLPPSLSGYSNPTSQRAVAESGGSSSHSRSSTLSVEQRCPTDGQLLNVTIHSLPLGVDQDSKASPDFDHSPLSMVPAVGTPVVSRAATIQSAECQSPFSPRPEPPPLLSLSQGASNTTMTRTEHDDVGSDSNSSFTRSPPLISPVVKLPDPAPVSPSSTSSWTMTSDEGSRRSLPPRHSVSLSTGINGTFSGGQSTTSDHTVPQLTLLVPNLAQNSGCPSSISPESAGIISASMTPDFLREARAYLSLTHQVQEPASPQSPRTPGISSPILSSTGLAIGERGRRREVRFEDNIMMESAWDRHSTSSDSSLDPPVVPPRPGGLRMNGVSKLPRFSTLRRPNRRWTNGQRTQHSRGHNRRQNGMPPPLYHCRSCYSDQCEEPTTTTCGHLFCYECISTAVMKDARCPLEHGAVTRPSCLCRLNVKISPG